MNKAKTIVRLASFVNRTPTGRPSATAVRKLAQYCAHGRGSEAEQSQRQPRGTWYTHEGKPVSHEATLAWVNERGKSHPFTHQFILSTKEASLTPEEYCRAMQAGGELFGEWRLMAHTDAEFAHAHAIAFSQDDARIKSAEFQTWWRAVRAELERLQASRLLQQEKGLALSNTAVQAAELGADMPTGEEQTAALDSEAPHQSRGWSLEM